jgi:aminopeptidase
MDTDIIKKYSEIVIKKGINLYKGQCVNINSGYADYGFAVQLAETAYEHGAKFVDINVVSNLLSKKRMEYSNVDYLDFLPFFHTSMLNEMLAYNWCNISIDNTAEIDMLKDCDADKMQILMKKMRETGSRMREQYMKHNHSWNVIAYPNEKWAGKIFKNTENPLKKLWDTVIPVLRLDKPDPVKAWEEHSARLLERRRKLNDLKIDKLVFKSSETELETGLNKTSLWGGGPSKLPDGRYHMPNIPTEEVFTTPDFRRTSGHVKIIKPVKVMEKTVTGAYFEFKKGMLVDFDAETGKDILEKFVNMDEGAKYLGEVALVDVDSPINKSGIIFSSILYDENASCHIALGAGYPSCLSNGSSLNSRKQLKNAGCNVSIVHTDFMIGTEDMDVTAVTDSGEVTIIKAGRFVI